MDQITQLVLGMNAPPRRPGFHTPVPTCLPFKTGTMQSRVSLTPPPTHQLPPAVRMCARPQP